MPPRLRRTLALLAAAAVLAPSPARASPFYGALRAGAHLPTELTTFGTGFAVEVAAGWWVTPGLSLELSVGRGTMTGPTGFSDGAEAPEPVDVRLTLFPIAATARYGLWFGGWRPYLLAGGGLEIVRVRPARRVVGAGPLTTEWTEPALLVQGGGGLVFQVDEHFAFGVEGRYARARAEHGGTVAADGVVLGASMEYRR